MPPVCDHDKYVLALRSRSRELHQLVHYALYRVETNVLERGKSDAEARAYRTHVLAGGPGEFLGQVHEARMARVVPVGDEHGMRLYLWVH